MNIYIQMKRTTETVQVYRVKLEFYPKTPQTIETEAQGEIIFLGSPSQITIQFSSFFVQYFFFIYFSFSLTTNKAFLGLHVTGFGQLMKSGRHFKKREQLCDARDIELEKAEVIINDSDSSGREVMPGHTGKNSWRRGFKF